MIYWNMFSNLSANSFVGTDSAGEIICSNITDLLEIENELEIIILVWC